MSLASNPWPSFEQEEQGTRTSKRNEMISNTQLKQQQPPPRYRPNPLHMPRSTSHDTGSWSNNGQSQQRQNQPTVGVVQPMNAAVVRTQTEQQHKYKALNRRHIPQVPPRNDQAAPSVKDFTAYKEQIRKQQQQQQQPASDPWKATSEQKKYYGDEFDKLPKIQDFVDGQLCLFVEGHVAKNFLLKSKLPNDSLVHIWELADIDKDGRLTLFEFALAFHFTLAKQRNFPLPERIPQRLFNDLLETEYPIIDQGEVKGDEENWEEFSEKSFSTVSSASTLPKFATNMTSKKRDGFVAPVPMRMTPSSLAARNVEMLQPLDAPAEGSMASKRKMYLELDRLPGADESSSAQSSSSSSPVSDERSTGIHESQSNLSYSSSKPLNPSGDDESHDDSMDHETLKTSPNAQKFADFPSYQNLGNGERNTPSVNSSDDSGDNEDSIHRAPSPTAVPSSDSVPPIMTSSLTSTGLAAAAADESKEREIEQVRSMVSSLKERNGRLLRLNQALSIELKDIIAERVLLEDRNATE